VMITAITPSLNASILDLSIDPPDAQRITAQLLQWNPAGRA
jgi:hypothetical protein